MGLDMIEPVAVAAYVEKLLHDGLSKPTVKQHLAAIRMMRHPRYVFTALRTFSGRAESGKR
jgi:hypothetical protein